MRLDDALHQIADIHLQMSRTRLFRGFQSTTTLFSAVVAAGAAVAQAIWIPDPARQVNAYLDLWCGAAVVCTVVVGVGLAGRYRRSDSPVQRELALSAVRQFIPCLIVGGLLTYILGTVAWQSLWLLPGLWAILFGMGVLATRPVLPAETLWIGMFYLMCGLLSIGWARVHTPFSPWAMGIPFGVGQSAAAVMLYWRLERNDVEE